MDECCGDNIGKELVRSFFKILPKNSDKDSCDALVLCRSDQNDEIEDLKKLPFHSGTLSSFFNRFSLKSCQEIDKINTAKRRSSGRENIDILLSVVQETDQDAYQICINRKLWRFKDQLNVVADPHFEYGHFMPLSSVISPTSRLILGLTGIQSSHNDVRPESSDKHADSRNSTVRIYKHFVRHFLSVFSASFPKAALRTVGRDNHRKQQIINGTAAKVSETLLPLLLAKIGGGSQNLPVFVSLQAEPFSSVSEVLRSQSAKISTVMRLPKLSVPSMSISGFLDIIQHGGNLQQSFPDKRELSCVQEFYQYVELEGKRLFQELDRDRDGLATLGDIEDATRRRKLPLFFAAEFLGCTKKHWLSRSFCWDEFSSVIKEKEPQMLSAFNSVPLCKSGTIQKSQLKALLQNARLPATEQNVTAMLKFLDSDKDGSVSYSQFRKFMLFVPTRHIVNDPWIIWFKAATVMSPTMTLRTTPKVGTGISKAVNGSSFIRCIHDTLEVGILVSNHCVVNPLLQLSHSLARMWKMRPWNMREFKTLDHH